MKYNQIIFDKNLWQTCKICNLKIPGGGGGVYKTSVFQKHLKEQHNINEQTYFEVNCSIEIPDCSCGICNKKLRVIIVKSSNFGLTKFACGRNPGVLAWSEKAKTERKGDKNPMFGKKAWNDGLTKETSETMMIVSQKMKEREISEETKQRQSEAAKRRLIHGHTGCPHSEESKQKMREATLRRIKEGGFKQNETKPVIKMKEILDSINIKYIREHVLECWAFDFYLPDLDIMIEVDGDYFHSNPKIYKDGPKTNTQKINWYRDIKKNRFCEENNIKLYRFWECDILTNTNKVKEEIENAVRENSKC